MYSSDNMKKWLASGITAIWCLLIGSIIPILLDSDLIGQSGNNLTYEEKTNELLLCVWFGIACSIFCGILFFIQISKYAKFMDRKYEQPYEGCCICRKVKIKGIITITLEKAFDFADCLCNYSADYL